MKLKTILLAIFALLFIAGCTSSSPIGSTVADIPVPSGPVKELTIDSYSWGFSQPNVQINKGDTVRLTVTSSSGVHGVAIKGYDVSTGPVAPGQSEVIEFVADKSGEFELYCNIPCGAGHRSMKTTLVVNE